MRYSDFDEGYNPLSSSLNLTKGRIATPNVPAFPDPKSDVALTGDWNFAARLSPDHLLLLTVTRFSKNTPADNVTSIFLEYWTALLLFQTGAKGKKPV